MTKASTLPEAEAISRTVMVDSDSNTFCRGDVAPLSIFAFGCVVVSPIKVIFFPISFLSDESFIVHIRFNYKEIESRGVNSTGHSMRDEAIDSLRGFLIICVVLGHLTIWNFVLLLPDPAAQASFSCSLWYLGWGNLMGYADVYYFHMPLLTGNIDFFNIIF